MGVTMPLLETHPMARPAVDGRVLSTARYDDGFGLSDTTSVQDVAHRANDGN